MEGHRSGETSTAFSERDSESRDSLSGIPKIEYIPYDQVDAPPLLHKSMEGLPACSEYKFKMDEARGTYIVDKLYDIFVRQPAERFSNSNSEASYRKPNPNAWKYKPVVPEVVLFGFTASRIRFFQPGWTTSNPSGNRHHNRAVGIARIYTSDGEQLYMAEQHYPNIRPKLRLFTWINPKTMEVQVMEELSGKNKYIAERKLADEKKLRDEPPLWIEKPLQDEAYVPSSQEVEHAQDQDDDWTRWIIEMLNLVPDLKVGTNSYREGRRGTFLKYAAFQKYDRPPKTYSSAIPLPFGDNHYVPGES